MSFPVPCVFQTIQMLPRTILGARLPLNKLLRQEERTGPPLDAATLHVRVTSREIETSMPNFSEHLPLNTADTSTNHSWEMEDIRAAIKEADAGDFATTEELNAIAEKWRPVPNTDHSGLTPNLWRGSLLALDCIAVPFFLGKEWAASQPGGSKLPRHK
jgi:hypothetical protein